MNSNLLSRHSGAGRNPVEKTITRVAGQHQNNNVVRFAEYFFSWIPARAGMTGYLKCLDEQFDSDWGFA